MHVLELLVCECMCWSYWSVSGCVEVYWCVSACVGVFWCVTACVGVIGV